MPYKLSLEFNKGMQDLIDHRYDSITDADSDEWMVQAKGMEEGIVKASINNFELSIVRKSNKHGRLSYGWFDKNKILIANSTIYGNISKELWPDFIQIAEKYCNILNAREKINGDNNKASH